MTHDDDDAPVTQPMLSAEEEARLAMPVAEPIPEPAPALVAAPAEPAARPTPLAVVEVLDRDGQVRQAISVTHWPLLIGRAFDNDVVLSDLHVAPEHLSVRLGAHGLELVVGNTRNGVQLGAKSFSAGETHRLATDSDANNITAGRTHLRLRLPGHALAPELPLAVVAPLRQRLVPILIAAVVLVAGMLFNTYLDTDADGLGRAAGNMLLGVVAGAAIWCGAWAMLSKVFTRQARFGWHLRVFLISSSAWLVVAALPALLAFALSWPWLTDFAFIGTYAVGAAALYFHLLAVEPARQRLLRWAAAACAVTGVALTLWFNAQRTDQLGEELYMSHLFPPVMRLAKPVANDAFIDDLTRLKPLLDKKAKETSNSDDAGKGDVEE